MSLQEIPNTASSGIAPNTEASPGVTSSMWRFINNWSPESRRFVLHRVCVRSSSKHRMQVYIVGSSHHCLTYIP